MNKTWQEMAEDLPNLDIPPGSHIENQNNLMIVDGNNLAYRYLKRANYKDYSADYIRTVDSLAKSYSSKQVIICFDWGKSYYRKDFFPEYKDNRPKPETDEEKQYYEDFFKCLNALAEELPYNVIKQQGVESDDLMAYLILKLKKKFDHIWVISSDKDIFQLIDMNVSIFNLYSRKEIDINYLEQELNITPTIYQLARIIQGDSGDNIKGIEGIGEVRSRDIARKYVTLNALIESLPIKPAKSKYMQNLNAGTELLLRNERLINLIDHHETAIIKGKDGHKNLQELEELCIKL